MSFRFTHWILVPCTNACQPHSHVEMKWNESKPQSPLIAECSWALWHYSSVEPALIWIMIHLLPMNHELSFVKLTGGKKVGPTITVPFCTFCEEPLWVQWTSHWEPELSLTWLDCTRLILQGSSSPWHRPWLDLCQTQLPFRQWKETVCL